MGQVVCATEAIHIIGQHNPLVFAVAPWQVFACQVFACQLSLPLSLISPSDPSLFLSFLLCHSIIDLKFVDVTTGTVQLLFAVKGTQFTEGRA